MDARLMCVAGARPNFMKVAPLVKAARRESWCSPVIVHTGQHYDDRMSGQFFRDLGIPAPDYNLEVGSGSHAQQTAEIIRRFEPVLLAENPLAVIVVGDVNSTMACALVAAKVQIPVVHVEAGLRSCDRSMPEEINRVVTDAISDLLLVSEESGRRNLLAEGVPAHRIHVVGNLMIDSLRSNLKKAEESDIALRLGIAVPNTTNHYPLRPYGLVTLHRPSNVDDPEQLGQVLSALSIIAESVPLYFPVHPRTRTRLEGSGICLSRRIHLIDPLGYLDFLSLMSKSSLVLTDSGGIQEETTVLGVPCLTLRVNTERPATIEEGTNVLAGTSRTSILAAWEQLQRAPKAGKIPKYWDGNAAARCLAVLKSYFCTRT